MKLLLEEVVSSNIQIEKGDTLLEFAIINGHDEIVNLLRLYKSKGLKGKNVPICNLFRLIIF